MLDPDEGRAPDGTIRTGASHERIAPPFDDIVDALTTEFDRVEPTASVYVYGSVATGQAVVGSSDVDILAIGAGAEAVSAIARDLSARFAGLCRGVEIGGAGETEFHGNRDEAYGNRVFLRHYCVHVAGPERDRSIGPFQADVRAARGFNGDIGRHLERWRSAVGRLPPSDLGRRVARKTLLAAAGIVSVHDTTWTTDRETAASRLGQIEPELRDDLEELLGWTSRLAEVNIGEVERMLDGTVTAVARRFTDDIGLWSR